MRRSLGEKIGEGAFAEIHVWAPGQVVKLFRAGVPPLISLHEARMTRAVFAAGGPAPEVFGEVTIEGRSGIVLPRFDGPTLLQLLRSGGVTRERAGTILATCCMAIHKTPPPPDVLPLRDWMDSLLLPHLDSMLPKQIATGVMALIEHLPPGDGLCHADVHLDNVIMTAEGPRLIDWLGAVRAPAALDLAYAHVILSEILPEQVDDPEWPRAVDVAVQSEYARLAGMPPAALTAARELYLPIVRTYLLGNPAFTPAQRERLIQRIAAALRPED